VNPQRRFKGQSGTISVALEQMQECGRNREWENTISSVSHFLDTQLGPREVAKARDILMATLVEKEFTVPKLKNDFSVDEIKRNQQVQI
jgi:hypothetical protein